MQSTTSASQSSGLSRRAFARSILLLAGGSLAGCTPLRALLGLSGNAQDGASEAALRAFVLTVIPDAPATDPHLIRIYTDPEFPFVEYAGVFVDELALRSRLLFNAPSFSQLPESARERVVRSGLAADVVTASLYRSAILAAQVSFYGSIYDDERGCALIEFPGANSGFDDDVLYHPNTLRLLGAGVTSDGNYF